MSALNDDELNSLLEQTRSQPPAPRPELAARALRAYQANVARTLNWRWRLIRPVPIPLPLGMLAAVFLILIGAAGGRRLEAPAAREHIVYRGCPAGRQEPSPPIASLTFKEFQPVRAIRPRVVKEYSR